MKMHRISLNDLPNVPVDMQGWDKGEVEEMSRAFQSDANSKGEKNQ